MQQELFNLTNSAILFVNTSGQLIELPSRGYATCEVEARTTSEVDGIPVRTKTYKPVKGLPPQGSDQTRLYIVDRAVAEALRDQRWDIVIATDSEVDEKTQSTIFRTLTHI